MQKVVFNANYLAYIDDATDTWMRERARRVRGRRASTSWSRRSRSSGSRRPASASCSSSSSRSTRWGTSSYDVGVVGRVGERPVLTATVVYVSMVPGELGSQPVPPHVRAALEPVRAGVTAAVGRVRGGAPLPRSFYRRPSLVVAPELLNKVLVAGAVPWSHRRGRGLRRTARSGQPRLPRPDGPQRDDVRPARPPVRVLHLRHALLRQRRHRHARRTAQAVLLRALAPLAGLDADARPGDRPARRTDRPGQWSGEALPGARHRARATTAPTSSAAAVRIVDDGTAPPAGPGVSTRIGITRAVDRPWRWFVRRRSERLPLTHAGSRTDRLRFGQALVNADVRYRLRRCAPDGIARSSGERV